jgi:hypothetical protein
MTETVSDAVDGVGTTEHVGETGTTERVDDADTIESIDTSGRFDPSLPEWERGRLERIASVQRELARMAEADEAAARLPPRRRRRTSGSSVVFSIRLDPAELAALEQQAALTHIKPTVLARNLVRTGLYSRNPSALANAVDRLNSAIEEVRSLLR